MTQVIFGIDPGSKTSGWALVEPADGARVTYLESGEMEAEPASLLRVLGRTGHRADPLDGRALAVETPSGWVHDAVRGKHLLATAVNAGGAIGVGLALDLTVVSLAADEVRRTLLGRTRLSFRQRKGDMDRALEPVLRGLVVDMPKRTNVHVRDALAVAVVASWKLRAKGARKVAS